MMNKIFLYFLFVIFPLFVNAQINKDGLPFIKNYSPDVYGAHTQNWSIVKDGRGVMYFANNYGLLTYDGTEWKIHDLPETSAVTSLCADKNGIVYYGALSDFGLFLSDSNGNLKNISLSRIYTKGITDTDFSRVWKTHVIDNYVYFQSFENICRFTLPADTSGLSEKELEKKFKVFYPKNKFHFSFKINNKLYVREYSEGLKVLNNDTFQLVNGGKLFYNVRIYTMLPYDEKQILIGTREKGFFLFNPDAKKNPITPFTTSDDNLLINSTVYDGTILPNGNFAIGTLAAGIIIFDKTGKITDKLNTDTGLPEQTILSVYCDYKNRNTSELWFATGNNGIFKAGYGNPYKVFTKHHNYHGRGTSIFNFKNKTYVATTVGLFYVKEIPDEHTILEPLLNIPTWNLINFYSAGTKENKLLAATDRGLYEIIDTSFVKIFDNVIYVIKQSEKIPETVILGFSNGVGIISYNPEKKRWNNPVINNSLHKAVIDANEDKNGKIWLGTTGNYYYVIDSIKDNTVTAIDEHTGLPQNVANFKISKIENEIIMNTQNGLYKYDEVNDKVNYYYNFGNEYADKGLGVYDIVKDGSSYILSVYSNNLKNKYFNVISYEKDENNKFLKKDSVSALKLGQYLAFSIYPEKDYIWIANEKGLYKFNKKNKKKYKQEYFTFIKEAKTIQDSIFSYGYFYDYSDNEIKLLNNQPESKIPILPYKFNDITFKYASPFFDNEDKILFTWKLSGHSEEWSKKNPENKAVFTNLDEGEYIFEVKAVNIYGYESKTAKYKFVILPPWYRTLWAYFIYFVLTALIVWTIARLYSRKLIKEKEQLEKIVKERTFEVRLRNAELQKSNREIEAQRNKIEKQKNHVESQKEEIEKQKESIIASIKYASRIQTAVLPPEKFLNKILPEYFVLFRPRDIVSGDFYWATQIKNKSVIVAADCTGHGVPGAFMSMLGMSFLNEIINESKIDDAGKILNMLRDNVKKALRQEGKEKEAKDGMDIALCIIDYDEMKMQYAGANNPMYLIRNDKITRYKADRMPIGIFVREKESFTTNIIEIQKNDSFYIFSDGFVDQFGGERGFKVKSGAFKKLLFDNHKKTLTEQKNILNDFIIKWMAHKNKKGKKHTQIDDMLVIGVRI